MNENSSAASHVRSPTYWSERYRRGDTPWDLGAETPTFAALLERIDFPKATEEQHPTVVVPGCGYGHDALMLARRGYRVTAVDFAPEPLEYLEQTARLAGLELYTLCSNVFDLPSIHPNAFDIVLEYTCYCAIDPAQRQDYTNVLATIVKPNGIVAGLFFPFDETEHSGPPFSVREEEIRTQFEHAGFVLLSSEQPIESHPSRAGRERLMLFRKLL